MMSLIISFGVFLLAITVHEFAHGLVAFKLGDKTAQRSGRLTLNPIAHIDPIGMIVVPIFLIIIGAPPFGWAKPVPIDSRNFANPKNDILWVGLAGPCANFLLAVLAAFILKSTFLNTFDAFGSVTLLGEILFFTVYINVILGIFNLIPIPPLDGSRVLFSLLPTRLAVSYISLERYGFILIFALLYMGLFSRVVLPLTLFVLSFLGF